VVIKDCPQLEKAEIKYFKDSKELSVSNCQNLTEFDCYYNYYKLEKLDIIDCSSLKNLICSFNKLTELNLKGLTNLQKLNCSNNRLTNLDISNLQLEELNISNNDGLAKLNEQLKKENNFVFHNNKYVKKQSAERWLNENFPKYEVSNLAGYEGKTRDKITKLNISEKGLVGELDLSDFGNLTNLNCSSNQLTKLNISNCQQLKILECYSNQLVTLDLINLTKLEEVVCNINQLTEIKLGNLTQLRKLFCRNNCLTDIDYSVLNPERLNELSIRNNNLLEKNISIFSKFTKLKSL